MRKRLRLLSNSYSLSLLSIAASKGASLQDDFKQRFGTKLDENTLNENLRTEHHAGTFFTGHYAESVGTFETAAELEPQNYLFVGNLADAYRWTPGNQAAQRRLYGHQLSVAG